MNPYEENAHNILSRLGVWCRGTIRLYRRPLMLIAITSVTMAVGVNAGQDNEKQAAPVVLAVTSD